MREQVCGTPVLVFSAQPKTAKIFLTFQKKYFIIYIEKIRKGGQHILDFNSLVKQSVEVIVDTCIYHEGNCDECVLKDFCKCEKPIEYNK